MTLGSPTDPTYRARATNLKKEEDSVVEAKASPTGADAPTEPPADPIKDLWDRGLAILGMTPPARSLLGKLRSTYGDPAVLTAIATCETELPSEPRAFLVACLQHATKGDRHAKSTKGSPLANLYEGAYRASLEYDKKHGISRDSGDDLPLIDPLLDGCRTA